MDFKSTFILSLLFVAYARAQLVCYHCENCNRDAAVIQPCGFDDPILTPPNFTTLPGGDFNDPNSPILTAPTFPGNGGGNGDAGNPGDPILTPPTYPGDNNNNNGGGAGTANPMDPILTPPSLPGDTGNIGGGGGGGNPLEPILTPPPAWGVRGEQSGQYVCLMAKSIVNNEEVVRRGCARMGRSSSEACDTISDGKYKQCSVCVTHLCNTES
ncbi:collagen alpha-5(IV) chain-like [Culex pipiens pallens]|uniref:collagen alpha-5(IV) chain-like n=1 Tax=Culex pipiens pallens TaxID=42434 RepID=UPI001954079E|nr:collagen alpha-5(IV) chain-like [Culex pipiens pallens]